MENNYVVIELELTAIQWAVDNCRMYLAGTEFTAITDHQPLVGILNGKNLDNISNQRIHRIVSKLIGYQFKLLWTPGKTQLIADAPSRAPVFPPEEEMDILVCTVHAVRATNDEALKDPAFERLIKLSQEDQEYQSIYETVKAHNKLPKGHPAQQLKMY